MFGRMGGAMIERDDGRVSSIDPQEAFRRGIKGGEFATDRGSGLAEEAAPFGAGANEAVLLAVRRLPGLTDPQAAYETGRALRLIVRLFDQAGAPDRVGRQFIDNLAGAVVVDHMRRRSRPWGAADTVDMFAEMYARILGSDPDDIGRIRRAVMDYAVAPQQRDRDSGRLGALFRRRRARNSAG
jgi:hypothetical protein